jgi:hypothetical protein
LVKAGFDHALAKLMTGEELASESESEAESSPGRTVRRKSRKVAPRKRTVAAEEGHPLNALNSTGTSSSQPRRTTRVGLVSDPRVPVSAWQMRRKKPIMIVSFPSFCHAHLSDEHVALFLDGNVSDLEEIFPQYPSAAGQLPTHAQVRACRNLLSIRLV